MSTVVLEVEERVESTSKPATQTATAAPGSHASSGMSFVIAAQAPTGASPSTAPSQKCESQVARFRYG